MIRRLYWFSIFCFLIYLLWPYDAFLLRQENPHTTALIELRKNEALEKNRKFKPVMQWRNLGEISPNLAHAVVLAEDDTFYQHHGFDLEQIQVAFQRDWKRQKFAYGGSTITQQLARTLFLRPRKTLLRKAKEAVLTVYLEAALSKKRILELYLNVVEWGPGIFGAEAASHYYFSKSAADLTPDEAVALVCILPSPRRWSPFSERAFMAMRRSQLLEKMQAAGYAPSSPVLFSDGTSTLIPYDPDSISEPPHEAPPTSDPSVNQ